VPLPRERRIFFTDFLDYKGYDSIIDYGGTNLPTYYDVYGDVFGLTDKYLTVSGSGQLIYNEEFIHNNFAVYALVRSTDNAIFSIQTRYTDDSYVQATFDFEDNNVTLEQPAAGSVASVNDFNFSDNIFYLLSLWAYENNFYIWINDYQINSMSASAPTAKTFALDFISGDLNVYQIKVYELVAPITPTLEGDPSNLFVEYRKLLQTKTAEVEVDNWNKFVEAHNRYRWNRDIGRRNINWEELGYPVSKPSTDAFFN